MLRHCGRDAWKGAICCCWRRQRRSIQCNQRMIQSDYFILSLITHHQKTTSMPNTQKGRSKVFMLILSSHLNAPPTSEKRDKQWKQRTVPLTQLMDWFRGCCTVYSVYSIVRHLKAVQVASENGFFTTFANFLSAQTSPALPCLSCPCATASASLDAMFTNYQTGQIRDTSTLQN